jgi:hypothetical protein
LSLAGYLSRTKGSLSWTRHLSRTKRSLSWTRYLSWTGGPLSLSLSLSLAGHEVLPWSWSCPRCLPVTLLPLAWRAWLGRRLRRRGWWGRRGPRVAQAVPLGGRVDRAGPAVFLRPVATVPVLAAHAASNFLCCYRCAASSCAATLCASLPVTLRASVNPCHALRVSGRHTLRANPDAYSNHARAPIENNVLTRFPD